jgi:hypothetical protein
MNDEEVSVTLPIVNLEECGTETNAVNVGNFIAQGAVTREDRLRELRKRIRTDHLKDQERRAIMNICEYYNAIFKLPGDKVTTTTAIEHTIPTPEIDPCRGIASRNYQIPEALKSDGSNVASQNYPAFYQPVEFSHYFGEKERIRIKETKMAVSSLFPTFE